jgi:hypothetical protein
MIATPNVEQAATGAQTMESRRDLALPDAT